MLSLFADTCFGSYLNIRVAPVSVSLRRDTTSCALKLVHRKPATVAYIEL